MAVKFLNSGDCVNSIRPPQYKYPYGLRPSPLSGNVVMSSGCFYRNAAASGASVEMTSSMNFCSPFSLDAEVLVVGGGGGGGSWGGGGGGGGGVVYNSSYPIVGGVTYCAVVGAGGGLAEQFGGQSNGGNSCLYSPASPSIIAYGGGRGAGNSAQGPWQGCSGSSGGGGAPIPGTPGRDGNVTAGYASSYPTQGYAGSPGTPTGGGGGGGAGGASPNDIATCGGRIGGNGVQYSLNGTTKYYGIGGSGAGNQGAPTPAVVPANPQAAPTGESPAQYWGQGGVGQYQARWGEPRTGGGGGGAGYPSGGGGSGTIIIKLPDTDFYIP